MSEITAAVNEVAVANAKKPNKAAILVDIGNSQTRCYFVYNGQAYYEAYINRYAVLHDEYRVPEDYLNERSSIIKVDDEILANGELETREFSRVSKKPTSHQMKSQQKTTKYTMSLLFIKAYQLVSKITGTPINELELEFDIVAALPPSEHKTKSDQLKALIRSIETVEMIAPVEFTKAIQLDKIYIVSEGAAAFTAAMYEEEDGDIVESEVNEKFLTGTVLVIDIGAGTTDIVLFKDADVVIESKESYDKGGNMVEASCRKLLTAKLDYAPDSEAMKSVLSTGLLHKGNSVIDVTAYLDQAKQEFGAFIYNKLVDYLDSHPIEIRDVKGLLVVGGGALPAVRKDEQGNEKVVSVSMAEVLVRFIMELTNTIELVNIKGYSPRLLNIEGLRLFYLYKNDD